MKVCLVSVEIFAWGKYGGFGRSTRLLGRELAQRGLDVAAVVPLRQQQRTIETLDGIKVFGFPMHWPFSMSKLFRSIDADIYHSQHPGYGTVLALRAMPHKQHMVTFRDPKDTADWLLEFRKPSISRPRVALNWLYEDSPLVRRAVRRVHHRYAAAANIKDQLRRIYDFGVPLETLPTPIAIPEKVEKSPTPVVAFVGRLDRRKRPQYFFRLAEHFPEIEFVAAGRAQDPDFERALRKEFAKVPNLTLAGFIDQFCSGELDQLLNRAWIVVNTAAREGMPTSLLEAAANRCAILSHVNPDRIAERFGYHAADDDFETGLAWLLQDGRWREAGRLGQDYVRKYHDLDSAVDRHIATYRDLLTTSGAAVFQQQ